MTNIPQEWKQPATSSRRVDKTSVIPSAKADCTKKLPTKAPWRTPPSLKTVITECEIKKTAERQVKQTTDKIKQTLREHLRDEPLNYEYCQAFAFHFLNYFYH